MAGGNFKLNLNLNCYHSAMAGGAEALCLPVVNALF